LTPIFLYMDKIEPGRRYVIGASTSADLVLTDPYVSVWHAEVYRDASGRIRIEDAGSTNGVWVNGAKAYESVLQRGDLIRVGRTDIEIR
jgi:pSer/pThr/pTyr-binding forkhead associated (FHA) protein